LLWRSASDNAPAPALRGRSFTMSGHGDARLVRLRRFVGGCGSSGSAWQRPPPYSLITGWAWLVSGGGLS